MQTLENDVVKLINAATRGSTVDAKLAALSQATEICLRNDALLSEFGIKLGEFIVRNLHSSFYEQLFSSLYTIYTLCVCLCVGLYIYTDTLLLYRLISLLKCKLM